MYILFTLRFSKYYDPSSEQFLDIHDAISKAESDLADRDCQISYAAAMLDDLRDKRTQDENNLKMIKGIMHPIRRIPPKILANTVPFRSIRHTPVTVTRWTSSTLDNAKIGSFESFVPG
jgi:hypothetical protein